MIVRRGFRLDGMCRVRGWSWEEICRRGCNSGGQDSERQLTLASILPEEDVYPQLMRKTEIVSLGCVFTVIVFVKFVIGVLLDTPKQGMVMPDETRLAGAETDAGRGGRDCRKVSQAMNCSSSVIRARIMRAG